MKGVIIAAGYGTRFLPVTKTIPKEMLPIIEKPAIDFILDEFQEAGITDVIVITSRRKKVLEDYLDREVELETLFIKENNNSKLSKIKVRDNMTFTFIRQQEMKGTGHAMLLLKSCIKDEPFIVAYPDDLFFKENPCMKLIEHYNKHKMSVIPVMEIDGDVSSYGVVKVSCAGTEEVMKIEKFVEKPPKGTEPSNLISVGRYLFTSEIFEPLEKGYATHKEGEYYHVDGINFLANNSRLLCYTFRGRRYDIGTPVGYIEAIIEKSLEREELRNNVLKMIKNINE